MEIVNVIVCSLNSVDSVKSWVITDKDHRQSIVELAEKEFERIAIEIGYDEDDHLAMEFLLDQGYFSNGNDKTVCISWSDSVAVNEERPTVANTKETFLKLIREKIKNLSHCFPIDLRKINREFELEDGNNLIRLNEEDYDSQHPRSLDVNYLEYDTLGVTDLEELLDILDEIETVDQKTQDSCKNENF